MLKFQQSRLCGRIVAGSPQKKKTLLPYARCGSRVCFFFPHGRGGGNAAMADATLAASAAPASSSSSGDATVAASTAAENETKAPLRCFVCDATSAPKLLPPLENVKRDGHVYFFLRAQHFSTQSHPTKTHDQRRLYYAGSCGQIANEKSGNDVHITNPSLR